MLSTNNEKTTNLLLIPSNSLCIWNVQRISTSNPKHAIIWWHAPLNWIKKITKLNDFVIVLEITPKNAN